jgi:aryl-alcohol dehydrogenase-like predicted oxidoreductase
LGCWAIGGSDWGGEQEVEDSLAAMQASWDNGIRHFDTAQGYGKGRSEEILGRFLQEKSIPRDEVFVASKIYPPHSRDKFTAERFHRGVDRSLQRLGLDVLDMMYIHWPVEGLDLRPAMEGLEDARSEGKIRHIGVSNFSVDQMQQVAEVGTIDAHQFCYNLFWRFAEAPPRDQDQRLSGILEYCDTNQIATVSYSSIAQGFLTGKYLQDDPPCFEDGDSRNSSVLVEPDVWPHVRDAIRDLQALAENAGISLTELAIQWCLQRPGMDIVLVGARNRDQAEKNARAREIELAPEVLDQATAISDRAVAHLPNDAPSLWRHNPKAQD